MNFHNFKPEFSFQHYSSSRGDATLATNYIQHSQRFLLLFCAILFKCFFQSDESVVLSISSNDFIFVFNRHVKEILKYKNVFMMFTIVATFLNTCMVAVVLLETLINGT